MCTNHSLISGEVRFQISAQSNERSFVTHLVTMETRTYTINPRRACAARVTVVVLSFLPSGRLSLPRFLIICKLALAYLDQLCVPVPWRHQKLQRRASVDSRVLSSSVASQ